MTQLKVGDLVRYARPVLQSVPLAVGDLGVVEMVTLTIFSVRWFAHPEGLGPTDGWWWTTADAWFYLDRITGA